MCISLCARGACLRRGGSVSRKFFAPPTPPRRGGVLANFLAGVFAVLEGLWDLLLWKGHYRDFSSRVRTRPAGAECARFFGRTFSPLAGAPGTSDLGGATLAIFFARPNPLRRCGVLANLSAELFRARRWLLDPLVMEGPLPRFFATLLFTVRCLLASSVGYGTWDSLSPRDWRNASWRLSTGMPRGCFYPGGKVELSASLWRGCAPPLNQRMPAILFLCRFYLR